MRDRYLVGQLAPRRLLIRPEEFDELAVADGGTAEEGPTDVGAPQAATMSPSSFGLTFCVDGAARELSITARWGFYDRADSATLKTPTGHPRKVWKRRQIEATLAPLALSEGRGKRPVTAESPEVTVQWLVHRHDGDWIVTVFLVNGQEERKRERDRAWLFQPEVVVTAPGGSAIFRHRPRLPEATGSDPEARAMAMLHRRHVEFAVGHGVGVHAETTQGSTDHAVRISTVVVPAADVAQVTAPTLDDIPTLGDVLLDMKALAEVGDGHFGPRLGALAAAYRAWIEREQQRIADPASGLEGYGDVARDAGARCSEALARIEAGLTLLDQNAQAAAAFRFMNRAMWQQRVRSIYAERVRRNESPDIDTIDVPANRSWYPFQLAFILLNLPALTDLHYPERGHGSHAIAYLLWFPTGGGKTEAYLGLAAYTMAVRRLQGPVAGRSGEHGVAVLMRYTLRLLTLQQFQRAAALMCACEVIRREALAKGDARWGTTPFRIGLWVGQRTTPNTTEQAAEVMRQAHGGRPATVAGGVGTPRQLTNCPWCGARIEPGRHIKVEPFTSGRGRTLIYCGDALGRCPFGERLAPGEGLPVVVVDEEIYRLLPAMLVATVDKFAQMPWNGLTQMLFGQVDGVCKPARLPLTRDRGHRLAQRARRALRGTDDSDQHAPTAGPDHPGRAAPHQRAARQPRGPLRDGRGPARGRGR